MKKIGVLALQGNFEDHIRILKKLNQDFVKVRSKKDLKNIDALIIPGGESSTIYLLLEENDMFGKIQDLGNNGMPMFGTCAGCILLSKNINNNKELDVKSLRLIDIDVTRNGYGAQIESFYAKIDFEGSKIETFFIRAPIISKIEEGVNVLASYNNNPVVVRQNKILVTTSHPELLLQSQLHSYFLSML